MIVLTREQCVEVGGGNGPSGGASQTCANLPNGGAQCTSTNGNAMVVNTYDSSGNLTSTMACTTNRSVGAGGGVKKAGINLEAHAGGGMTCTRSGPASSPAPSRPASAPGPTGLWMVQMPVGS